MLEREQKYDVDPGFSFPDLAQVKGVSMVADGVEETLEAIYFDTADHRLASAGVTLRRRTGGHDDGWHLKLPSAEDPDSRHEVRVGLGRATRTVPKRLRSTAAGLVGSQPLDVVATIRTHRTTYRVLDDSAAVLAEIADDTVDANTVAVGSPDRADEDASVSMTWREIEVELAEGGDPALLGRIGKRLVKAGARRADHTSKVSRLVG